MLPSESGNSRKMACINELLNKIVIFITYLNYMYYTILYTFPAPTGPIIATNRPGITVKLMFSKEFSV